MPRMSINGILNINKPEGKTSFQIVALVRHLSAEKHVGHIGTLDPLARGVLPICIGAATKIIQFIDDNNKTYQADIELGVSTDTYDREGTIVSRKEIGDLNLKQIEDVLASFEGVLEQIPPRYSALKYQGKRYYELARADIPFQPKSRKVEIYKITINSVQLPVISITIECGKGTYIRSLAHDIGEVLHCGAHLKNLNRLRSGIFHIEDSIPYQDIGRIFKEGKWDDVLYPVDKPLETWRKVTLTESDELAIKTGNSISLNIDIESNSDYIRAHNGSGKCIALLQYITEQKLWHPKKVFVY
jgi:tRNA pseudouridine55 synthase